MKVSIKADGFWTEMEDVVKVKETRDWVIVSGKGWYQKFHRLLVTNIVAKDI